MIDRQQATNIARSWLAAHPVGGPGRPLELVVVDEHTLEVDFGWVFFYTSKVYHETGDFSYALAGNGPLIVDRVDGSVHPTGTAYPPEHYLTEYRNRRLLT